ncbi:hypothetical protein PTKIN_Ptkin14bG0077500 [Pterospermum kingtungense]
MAKEHCYSIFQLLKDENLTSPEDEKTIVRTARFLKPCVQTVSQAVTVSNAPLLFEMFSQNSKGWPEKVEIKGWHVPQKHWEEWVEKMAGKYSGLWKLTGICDAIMSSIYEMKCNKDLVLGLVEFWCPETNTFVFPWGEATVTLEDVMILGGFSTLGEPVTRPLQGNLVKTEEEMNKKRLIMSRNKSKKASHGCWIKHFMEQEEERGYEHVAFLSLWLSRYVFPSLPEKIVSQQVFPVAIHLSSNTKMALAPAVLASLYKNLTWLKNQAMSCPEEITVSGPLQLLQLWAFERFPCLGPTTPNTLKPGEPRAARFHRLSAKISLSLVRSVLRLPDNFVWRPYIADLKNWSHPSYYKQSSFLAFDYNDRDDDLNSFARCLVACVLVGLDCKEEYLPHRVAMQLGYDQGLPAAFPVSTILWENARFSVQSRSFRPCVSVRYVNWWTRSMSARKAALKNITSNQNRSSPSVLAKRNADNCTPQKADNCPFHSNESGVKKPKTLETKISTKAETEGRFSSFANEYAAKTKTHRRLDFTDELDDPVSSVPTTKISSPKIVKPHVSVPVQVQRTKGSPKDSAAIHSLKSKNAVSQVSGDKNRVKSPASVVSDSKVKRQANEEHSNIDTTPLSKRMKHAQVLTTKAAPDPKMKKQAYDEHIDIDHKPLAERMKHICGTPKREAGFDKASPRSQFRTTESPASRVPNQNVNKRKLSSTIAARTATTLPFQASVRIPVNTGGFGQKLKRIVREATESFGHSNGASDVSEHRRRVEQKKRFGGSPKDIGEKSKTTRAEGFLKNSKNVTSEDTTSVPILKFGLELEARLTIPTNWLGYELKMKN